MRSNKTIGNSFESELCDLLFAHGYWAHNLAQNHAGQPADVIAVKGGVPYLIDAKHCEKGYFSKERIEDNQRTAMSLWEDSGNGSGWFAVKINNVIYMVEIWRMEMSDKTRLDDYWFRHNAMTLDQWFVEMG